MGQTAMIEYRKINHSLLQIIVEGVVVGKVFNVFGGEVRVILYDQDHFPDVDINEAIATFLGLGETI